MYWYAHPLPPAIKHYELIFMPHQNFLRLERTGGHPDSSLDEAVTVIARLSLEQIEPVEGQLDFSVVDGLVEDARSTALRFVIICFWAFHNAFSIYAPTWVRADRERPRRDKSTKPPKTPSPTPDPWRGQACPSLLTIFSKRTELPTPAC